MEGAMADKENDPAELWRTMLGEMEKGFNAFANQAMATPEFSKAMNAAGSASAGAQKQFGDMMERYLSGMNMPSRAQIVDFGERLASIERDLAEIKSMLRQVHQLADPASQRPRPPRTRKPSGREGGTA
jgi:hypothetical protein